MKYLLLALALTGCAAERHSTWYRPGADASAYYQDKGQCDAQAFSVAGGNLMQIAMVQNGCMRGKGWQLIEQ